MSKIAEVRKRPSRRKIPARTASRVIGRLFAIADISGETYDDIAKGGGIHAASLANWRQGRNSPRLTDFENVAQTLGHRVELVPIREEET